MIPGRAAAALPAKLDRARPRAWRCFFHPLFQITLVGWLGRWCQCGHTPPPPVSASTRVEIAIPTAVRMDAIVILCHRLLQPSELSCGWGDPRGVKRLIINWCQRFGLFPSQGGLCLFCATKSAVDCAREVLEFDVLNIASATTKGFVCLLECSLSSAT